MDLTQKVMRDVESVRKPVGLPFDTVDIPVIVIITVMLESLVWDGMFGEPLICLLSYQGLSSLKPLQGSGGVQVGGEAALGIPRHNPHFRFKF